MDKYKVIIEITNGATANRIYELDSTGDSAEEKAKFICKRITQGDGMWDDEDKTFYPARHIVSVRYSFEGEVEFPNNILL